MCPSCPLLQKRVTTHFKLEQLLGSAFRTVSCMYSATTHFVSKDSKFELPSSTFKKSERSRTVPSVSLILRRSKIICAICIRVRKVPDFHQSTGHR